MFLLLPVRLKLWDYWIYIRNKKQIKKDFFEMIYEDWHVGKWNLILYGRENTMKLNTLWALTSDTEDSALLQRTPNKRAVLNNPVLHVNLPFLISREGSNDLQVGDLVPLRSEEVVVVFTPTPVEQDELLWCFGAGLDQWTKRSTSCTWTYL